jgi:hypothetical protein
MPPDKREPPPRRRLSRSTLRLGLLRLLCDRLVALRVFPPEPLHASCRIHQTLLAGKEWVAHRADFHVNFAFVGRARFKAASARAQHAHCGVIGMNTRCRFVSLVVQLHLGHLLGQTFPSISVYLYCRGIPLVPQSCGPKGSFRLQAFGFGAFVRRWTHPNGTKTGALHRKAES